MRTRNITLSARPHTVTESLFPYTQGVLFLQKGGPGFPSKQALLPNKQIIFTNNSDPNYGHYNNTDLYNTPSKYADLFVSPVINPNMYSFDTPMPTYPLDTVIPSYPTPQKMSHDPANLGGVANPGGVVNSLGVQFAAAKKSSAPELENLLTTPTMKTLSPTSELESFLKLSDSDFTSLLSAFPPTNTDPRERGPGDFAIPSASTGIFDSLPPEFFPEGVSPSSSSSSPPATVSLGHSMDGWRGDGEKWSGGMSYATNSLPLPPMELDPASLWTSSQSSSHSELTPLFEALPPLNRDLPLPTSSLSPPSHYHTPTVSPSRGGLPVATTFSDNTRGVSNGEKELTFDEQLDFFDDGSLDWDSILPPAKKLQGPALTSHSEASSPVSHMHISPAHTPLPSAPPSPVETKPILTPSLSTPPPTPSSEQRSDKLAAAKPSPLLFGKTEDEILLKVLSPRSGSHSKPVTREQLVSMPVEEFNRLLDLASLNDIEVAFMKEWRRRGKNKTAAMIARKRKRDELTDLDVEVDQLRKQKTGLKSQYEQLRLEIAALKERAKKAEERVYQKYSRQSGVRVSRDTHTIHVDKAGKVLLGPRVSPRQLVLVK